MLASWLRFILSRVRGRQTHTPFCMQMVYSAHALKDRELFSARVHPSCVPVSGPERCIWACFLYLTSQRWMLLPNIHVKSKPIALLR